MDQPCCFVTVGVWGRSDLLKVTQQAGSLELPCGQACLMLQNKSWGWEGRVGKRPWLLQTANNGVKQEADVDNELDIRTEASSIKRGRRRLDRLP